MPSLVFALLAAGLTTSDPPAATPAQADPWYSDIQASAPSINTASPDLLDRADFPARAGLAWDQRLTDVENNHALTLSVTPLAALDLVRRAAEPGLAEPSSSSPWDRAAFRVTMGGPLQFADSLRVARAGRASDHVTSELKLRLLEQGERSDRPEAGTTTLALALGADNLGTGFGLDRYGATLIAEREARRGWTANAGYRILERYKTKQRLAETKLGLGTEWHGLGLTRSDILDLGLAGDCLVRNHGRPALWQGGANLDFHLPDGLLLSLAARRSQRAEIRGDPRTRAVLSVGYAL